MKLLNDDCRNFNCKADVIHLGYINRTLDFLKHSYNNLNNNGVVIFHEAYNNNWLGFKRRSDWGSIPKLFKDLMQENGFTKKNLKESNSMGRARAT